jgi:bifunctional non-homologous end joining protein LigD
VTARPEPRRTNGPVIEGVRLTHPERELWPGITKRDLAEYWQDIAPWALPGITHRPLAILRCPDGIGGERFFQKHGRGWLPPQIREGEAGGQSYFALDGLAGLVAAAQISAIELHAWGAAEADPLHPDRLVFDLDPGEGVGMAELARVALDVRERLGRIGLASFCRTSGAKGLHIVAPLRPDADWTRAHAFCRALAGCMAAEVPDRYVAVVEKSARQGRILVDWLRNGLGATAVASYSPRARPGAGVATPLTWREVGPKLDPATHTLRSVPGRLRRLERDPWEGFAGLDQSLPEGQP